MGAPPLRMVGSALLSFDHVDVRGLSTLDYKQDEQQEQRDNQSTAKSGTTIEFLKIKASLLVNA